MGEGTLGRGLGIGSQAGGLWDGRECVSLRAGEVHFGAPCAVCISYQWYASHSVQSCKRLVALLASLWLPIGFRQSLVNAEIWYRGFIYLFRMIQLLDSAYCWSNYWKTELCSIIVLIIWGGTTEAARAVVLTRQLSVPVDPIQVDSHTLFLCSTCVFLINLCEVNCIWHFIFLHFFSLCVRFPCLTSNVSSLVLLSKANFGI